MVPEERGTRPHPSGFRTFLNWFKRVEKERERNRPPREPSPSPVVESDSESDGSETSTATASSFAFLPPAGYRPYGDALAPHKYIASGPYTDTYRRRVAERDRRRRIDSGVTLRKKYRLLADNALGTLTENNYADPAALETPRVGSEPPSYDSFSLPAMGSRLEPPKPEHRRAASESKFVRPRPVSYVHVKGKRRAPPPPTDLAPPAPLTATLTRRVKRMAPQPPSASETATSNAEQKANVVHADSNSSRTEMRVSELLAPQTMLTTTYEVIQTNRVLPSAPPLTSLDTESRPSLTPSPSTTKKPLLLHSKSEESWRPRENGELSPKPWYKRQFSENKTKSKEEKPRRPELPDIGFFRYSKIFESKKATSPKSEQKRFSGALPNISELDREAAEILQMHKKARKEENNNSPGLNNPRSARLLITKFNQMNNVKTGEELIDKTDESKLKSAEDTWVCMKCEKRNNAKKIICSQCFSKKPREDDMFTKNLKEDLLQSFESEVLDALKHLGDMTSTNGTKAEAKTDNKPSKEDEIVYKNEEKQKLRDMLREMKNSLPKQHKTPKKDDTENTKCQSPIYRTRTVLNEGAPSSNVHPSSTHHKLQNLLNRSDPTSSTKSASADTSSASKRASAVDAKVSTATHEHVSPSNSSAKESSKPSVINSDTNSLYANVSVPLKNATETSPPKSQKLDAKDKSNPKILLKELQTAISAGDDCTAADVAKKLAQMKVHCTVLSSTATLIAQNDDGDVTVSVYIEDAESAAGPVRLRVRRRVTLPELRAAVQRQLHIPTELQRWIVGKNLCVDDKPLSDYNGGDFSQPLFLYLVSPAKTENDTKSEMKSPVLAKKSTYVEEPRPGPSKSSATTSAAFHLSVVLTKTPAETKLTFSSSKSPADSVQKSNDTFLKYPPAVKDVTSKLTTTSGATSAELDESTAPLFSPVVSTKAIVFTAPTAAVSATPTAVVSPNATAAVSSASAAEVSSTSAAAVSSTPAEPVSSTPAPAVSSTPTAAISSALTAEVSSNQAPSVVKPDHYQELVDLESRDLIPNREPFSCVVCLDDCAPSDGVVLRDCLHAFCRSCLADTVRHCDQAQVTCPYRDANYSCDSTLQEREVRALVSKEDYERHLARSVQLAESTMRGAFHCKTADCRGWCVYENTVNIFRCPICKKTNCLTCQVIHEGENCAQYQARIAREAQGSGAGQAAAECTRRMLQDMCSRGDALECPSCQVVLMKKWGCDWVRCSMCKTEICWVTRGARWGPGGKGDTSAGCRCGVDGVKCHPSCNYCH